MKMKKALCLLICLLMIVIMSGCGDKEAATPTENTVKVTAEPTAAETALQPSNTPAPQAYDVDLTRLSGTVAYAKVYNMMNEPETYVGKNVKMGGSFAVYFDEGTGKYYFACVIQDALACCAQGIEFVLGGDAKYPEDYPEIDDYITVEGIFDTYYEGDYMYCTLRDARLL